MQAVLGYDFYVHHSFSSNQAWIEQSLEQLANELAASDVIRSAPAPVDRWVASAGVQKAIRRNDQPTALACTKTLLLTDPDRLWRRLCGISLEDIGIANLNTAAEVLAVSGQRVWRSRHGGDELVATHLVKQLCRGSKERSTDDLLAIADWHPAWQIGRERLASLPQSELLDLLSDDRQPLPLRAMAAWYGAGTDRLWRYRIPLRKGDPKAVLATYRGLNVPEALLELARVGINKTRSALPIMLPLVWLASRGHDIAHDCTTPLPSPAFDGVPAYIFDGFSRLGRRALSEFLQACPPVRSFLAANSRNGDRSKILSMLVFHAEGGLVDRRLVWTGSEEITREGRIADTAGAGLAIARVEEAMSLVRECLPALHKARQSVFIPTAISLHPGSLP